MKLAVSIFFVVVLAVVTMFGVGSYYSYVFSRKVVGEVISVDRAGTTAFAADKSVAFSFGVAIKDKATGEIVTSSSEDRQWAVVDKGMCAEAKFFPYPPWNLEKAGTYYGARLLKLTECK